MAEVVAFDAWDGPGVLEAAELLKGLPPGWLVIFGRRLAQSRGGLETDFIVVGRHIVLTLESKHWQLVRGDVHSWRDAQGNGRRSPIRQADKQAAMLGNLLRSELSSSFRGAAQLHVDYRVLLTNPHVRVEGLDDPEARERLLTMESAVGFLKGLDKKARETPSGALISAAREQIVEFLKPPLAPVKPDPELLETLNQAEGEAHRSVFVGREATLERLEGWIRSRPGSYLLLTGAPGLGKSAIAAALASRLTRGGPQPLDRLLGEPTSVEWPVLLHHVRSERRPSRFLRSVVAEIHRRVQTRPGPEDREDLGSALRTYL